jgi:ribonucleotide reductase beta subunit family protein with ferritin-like domain
MSVKLNNSNNSVGTDNKTDSKTQDIEPIFDPANDRVNLLPIVYPQFWEFVKDARASFWLADEISFTDDIADWNTKLNAQERQFLEANFALFMIFDQIIIKNLETDFVEKITIPEIRTFYRFQEAIEDIHVHAYNLFPINFVKDPVRLQEIQEAVKTFPILGKMADWCKKWNLGNVGSNKETDELKAFTRLVVANILIEGIIFSGSFAAIFYMKKRNILPSICQLNSFISRDEYLHTKFGIAIYHFLRTKLTDDEFITMLDEIVKLSEEWCVESVSVDLIGMNSSAMAQYIKFVADQISLAIISRPVYNASNPFPWMEMISLQGKTNFFDRKVTQYSKISGSPSENRIAFNADF